MFDFVKEFLLIWVWGIVGWIVVGLVISYFFGWDLVESIVGGGLCNIFLMSVVVLLVFGLFSFILFKMLLKVKGMEVVSISEILGLEVFILFKECNFLIFFVSFIFICILLVFYYQQVNLFLVDVGVVNVMGKMMIGQVFEVLFMLFLFVFLKCFGIKNIFLFGMLVWVLCYLFFVYGDVDGKGFMFILGIVLYGICYDFFFVLG